MRKIINFGTLNLKGLETAWTIRNWQERQVLTIGQIVTFGYN